MKNKIIYPDFENSILNLISSILSCYNIETELPPLQQLDISELKEKQNLIFVILDGLGNNLIEKFGNVCSLLRKYRQNVITSVFPPTTTAAITSLMTAKFPFEHGAIGWSLYFKEAFKLIDFLPANDSVSQTNLGEKFVPLLNMLPPENIFQKITKKNKALQLFQLSPSSIHKSNYNKRISAGAKVIPYNEIEEMFGILKSLISEKKKKLIVVYSSFPDALEHRFGVYSSEVKDFLQKFNNELEKFLNKTDKTKSTLFITADHGLIDVKKYYSLDKNNPLYDDLILPAFPEPRFVSFFVKSHKTKKFEEDIALLNDEFIFMKRDEFLRSSLVGKSKLHPRIDDFIGNYVGIAIADSAFRNVFSYFSQHPEFKAHHSGLTGEEMLVPLIKINF